LIGDPLYGNRSRTIALKDMVLRNLIEQLSGQALHAKLLGFIHPTTGKYLEFSSPIPEQFQNIITHLDQSIG